MEFLTIRECAKRGPLNECLLRRMCKRGELPGFKNGNRFLINYPALMELLEQKSRKAVEG